MITRWKMIVAAVAAVFAFAAPMDTVEAKEKSTRKLRHVVCFKFKEDASKKQVDAVVKAFAALEKKIPAIKDFEMGTNNSPE